MVETKGSDRRRFFKTIAAAGAAGLLLDVPGAFAEQLASTPEQTEGPYYPTNLPLDTDNDLVVINNNLNAAIGQITYISGRVLSPTGAPVRNAYVEIWHADTAGAYIHPQSMGYATRDLNFQGFGRFITGSSGEYVFRTIKPGLYTGRTRHIHFKVKAAGLPTLTSQLYFLGEPQNASDGVLSGIRDAQARSSVIVPFVSVEGSTVGALAARFDVVLTAAPAATPSISITNLTNPTRTGILVGENWRLDVRGASAGAPVYLHLWKGTVDLGISGPYGSLTDGEGGWFFAGSYGTGDVGAWQVQAVIGSANSSEASAPVSIRVSRE